MRLGARIARLPTLPVHDWLDRAAEAMAPLAPHGRIISLLGSFGLNTSIERIGAWGAGADLVDRSGEAIGRRAQRLASPAPGVFVTEPGAAMRTALGPLLNGADRTLVASAPLEGESGRRITLVVSGCAGAGAGKLLRSSAPALAYRALVALGPAPRSASEWLAPSDVELLSALVAGQTIPEIAAATRRSAHNVQDAIKAMYKRLGRNRRTELVARAVGHIPADIAAELEAKGCAQGAL